MEIQKIAFRVDASSQIGTGHFMRCLTLADELKQHGAQIRFVSRHMPEHLRDMLIAREYEFMLLHSSSREAILDDLFHAHWLGTSQQGDAQDTIQALSDQKWDWLIVDHYALDARWENDLRHTAKKILVIDDIADRQHDCDVLLDQNFYADMNSRYTGIVPKHCQLLLGPRYALLREEFRQLRKQVKPRTGPVKRILIFFGGVDSDNYTGRAIEALVNISIPELYVDVVIGSQHPCREQIEATCALHGFICHVQTSRMAELMAAADLAILAGGTVTWERCCLGLPAVVVITAENQRLVAEHCGRKGLHLYLGEANSVQVSKLNYTLQVLLQSPTLLQHFSEQSRKLVDGRGATRVVQYLMSLEIVL